MGIFDFFSSSSNFEKKVLFGTLHLSLCAVDGETSTEEVTKSLELLKIKPSDIDYFMKRVQKKIDKGGDSLQKELLKLSDEDKKKLVNDLIEISKSDGHFDQAEADVILNLTGAWGWNTDLIEEALALSGFKKNISEDKSENLSNNEKTSHSNVNAIFLWANSLQNDGDHNKAIDAYLKVLDLIKKNDANNIIKDNFYVEKTRLTGISVNMIPIDGVYFNLGSSYTTLKLYDKAKYAFEQALKVNKDADALIHHNLGCAKIYLRDFSTSISDFDNALKKDPNYYNSYYMRAVAYASKESKFEDRDKAFLDIKRYLEYQPDDKSGNELLALLEPTIELKNTEELKAVLPPSKSIDDLNLDPETKKKVEESTVFVNNDLTMDVSKGAGKEINESLDFFKHIKGIDIKKIVFDLKTFQIMDETVPPFTDVNGNWHVKFGHTIMKCLSEENLEKELDELLKLNNIPKGSAKVNLRQEHVVSVQAPITFYKGNGFIIDVPPMQGTYKLIVIKKDE
jgi:tetratricopeptide (TPR) repeat protein